MNANSAKRGREEKEDKALLLETIRLDRKLSSEIDRLRSRLDDLDRLIDKLNRHANCHEPVEQEDGDVGRDRMR